MTYSWQEYRDARREHAWLLKAEGLTLEQIAKHMGCSRERARQMLAKFRRKAEIATRRSMWSYYE